jgi:hypothetical protein
MSNKIKLRYGSSQENGYDEFEFESHLFDDADSAAEALMQYLWDNCDGWEWMPDTNETIWFEYGGEEYLFTPLVEYDPVFSCRYGLHKAKDGLHKARRDDAEKVAEFKKLLDKTTHVTAEDLHTPLK